MSPVSFRRRGISLPADTVESMTQLIVLQEPATLTKFLGKFAEYMPVIAWVKVKPEPIRDHDDSLWHLISQIQLCHVSAFSSASPMGSPLDQIFIWVRWIMSINARNTDWCGNTLWYKRLEWSDKYLYIFCNCSKGYSTGWNQTLSCLKILCEKNVTAV